MDPGSGCGMGMDPGPEGMDLEPGSGGYGSGVWILGLEPRTSIQCLIWGLDSGGGFESVSIRGGAWILSRNQGDMDPRTAPERSWIRGLDPRHLDWILISRDLDSKGET